MEKKEASSIAEKPKFAVETNANLPVFPEIEKEKINIRYPLIAPYAFAHIFWDNENKELVYFIEEPMLNDEQKKVLELLEEGIRELINISFISVKSQDTAIEYLEKNLRTLLDELRIELSKESYLKIMYYIYRDFVGLNEIEPLLSDYFIEDIECNGINFPIYIVHRKYRNMRTNIMYNDIEKLTTFVEKLAQKAGQYVSYANPLLDAALPDGSVDYEEQFVYKQNGWVKTAKIGEFIDKYYRQGISNVPMQVKNIQVPAFGQNMKITWKNVDYVYRHNINEPIYKLKLEAGRNIKLTGVHSVFVLRKDMIKPELVSNLRKGDYVIAPLALPENNTLKELNLALYLSKTDFYKKILLNNVPLHVYKNNETKIKKYYLSEYKRITSTFYEHKKKRILPIRLYGLLKKKELKKCKIITTSEVQIPTFLKVNKELMKILGYYIGEGWFTKTKNHYRIYFCFNKKERNTYVKELNNCFIKCFSNNLSIEPENKNALKLRIQSLLIYFVFRDVLKVSKGARHKEIPEIVFNVSKNLQEEFIKAWHNSDFGSTASKNLANQISYLSLFKNRIVPFYERDREVILEGRKLISHEIYTNYFRRKPSDFHTMIPMELFNPLNSTHHRLRNNKIRRDRLKKILDNIRFKNFDSLSDVQSRKFIIEWVKRGFIKQFYNRSLLTKKGQDALAELYFVKRLIDSDFAFLKINEIDKLKSTKNYVYDVSVPKCENFIAGFGGICCHNSRVNATFTQDISSRGPTFTIRKFTKIPWTPTKLIQMRTATPQIFAYLWILIEHGLNVMIVGGTGSGKTTLLNALTFFIPPQARIVSIEDTRELALEHDNWLPSVAREGVGLANLVGQKYGEVSLFDLLKESFRQNPDYVIVGEVRGKEAYVLFQGMGSGHSSFGTMHADSVDTMIKRLQTPPISLSASLVESMDVVLVMAHGKIRGEEARRIREVDEIINVQDSGTFSVNRPFVWDPTKDMYAFSANSHAFNKIITRTGASLNDLTKEFNIRTQLLISMYNSGIFDSKSLRMIVNEYYKDPIAVIRRFRLVS